MKRMLSTLALILASASVAGAAVDGPRFDREVSKLTLDMKTLKARHLCICRDPGANQRQVGYLIKSLTSVSGGVRLTITCQLPTLSALDRTYVSAENCSSFDVFQK